MVFLLLEKYHLFSPRAARVALRLAFCAVVVLAWPRNAALADSLPLAVEGKVTLVDLSASWCGPCKRLKPVLEDLARELGDRAAVVIVDAEKDSRAKPYKVRAFPTLVFHDATGEVRFRSTGLLSREAILARLEACGMPAEGEATGPELEPAQKSQPFRSSRNVLKVE